MSKSYDLPVRLIPYVRSGGSKAEAARLFGVTRRTIYNWLAMGDDVRQKAKPDPKRNRKVPEGALKDAVKARNDARSMKLLNRIVKYSNYYKRRGEKSFQAGTEIHAQPRIRVRNRQNDFCPPEKMKFQRKPF